MEFDIIRCMVLVSLLAAVLVVAVAYYGYKVFHEPAVVMWLAKHGIVEIEDEEEER